MKKIVIGILAHVDAGKTTLSEGMLYQSGSIRKMGRVDNGDAFLDTYELEKARGITIFSKQAVFDFKNTQITLLDTPGHVDFSAEMERTLQVMDYAILVVSGADGVQGHTQTLWYLLNKYKIPVFLFINKMDQNGTDKETLLEELNNRLDSGFIEFGGESSDRMAQQTFYENVAMSDEILLNYYLETGTLETEQIQKMITERKIFPCFFGSALKMDGVKEFLEGIDKFTCSSSYQKEFGAKIFKIARDEKGNRLTYMKITGGNLPVKTLLTNKPLSQENSKDLYQSEIWEEKVNQIRIYSGEKFTVVNQAESGTICAVTGLSKTYPGQGLGSEVESHRPLLTPVLTYKIELPSECDAGTMLPKLRELEEEEPQLHIVWNEGLQEIHAQSMGEVQIEILKSIIWKRFGVKIEFGPGNIIYKETINDTVEGVGHFEPLRHYAEVHLLLERGEPGSGLEFLTDCSEDMLDRNWQRLILTHLGEKEHKGVLTGSPITDMKITLIAGRAHQKHTEGGDFRQATYRAVRQGLKQAQSVLLEPYYEFRLEIPENTVGRAMADIEKMHGTFEIAQSKGGFTILTGCAPVVNIQDYYKEVMAYAKGYGKLFCTMKGYEPCHNTQEVIEKSEYNPDRDIENPTGSVFCAHGSGFVVEWDHVKDFMHIASFLDGPNMESEDENNAKISHSVMDDWIDEEEVTNILDQVYFANKRDKTASGNGFIKRKVKPSVPLKSGIYKKVEPREEYLLVDGYNIVFGWQDLKEIAEVNIDGAREKLIDILCNYQGIKRCNIIVVFDAYRVKEHVTEFIDYQNIHIVYTKEAETADQYIEKFAYANSHKYNVTVATSDGLEQIIIRGKGCGLLSAKGLKQEINLASKKLRNEYLDKQPKERNYLLDSLTDDVARNIEEIRQGKTDGE